MVIDPAGFSNSHHTEVRKAEQAEVRSGATRGLHLLKASSRAVEKDEKTGEDYSP